MSNKEARGKKEHQFLLAENKELRKLWAENEKMLVYLSAKFNRFLNLKWYQRLFIRFDDPKLYSDSKVRRGKR